VAVGNADRINPILKDANANWAAQAKALEVPVTLKAVQAYADKFKVPLAQAMRTVGRSLSPAEQQAGLRALGSGPLMAGARFVGRFDPTKNPLAFGVHFLAGTLPYAGAATAANRGAEILTAMRMNALRQNILNQSPYGQLLRNQPRAPYNQPLRRAISSGLLGGYIGSQGSSDQQPQWPVTR